MNRVTVYTCRPLQLWLTASIFPMLLAILAVPALAESPIVRIEEDWEMVLLTPDTNSVGPQVVCAFSPVGSLNSVYATFELNHGTYPNFSRGGLNLHVWNDDAHVTTKTFPNASVLATSGETVRWTQRLEAQNGQLIFEVVNGHSATWGEFGGEEHLKAVVASSITDLNGYSPELSVSSSGITFASNRVASLKLKTVRAFRADGTVVSVTLDKIVHQTTGE